MCWVFELMMGSVTVLMLTDMWTKVKLFSCCAEPFLWKQTDFPPLCHRGGIFPISEWEALRSIFLENLNGLYSYYIVGYECIFSLW